MSSSSSVDMDNGLLVGSRLSILPQAFRRPLGPARRLGLGLSYLPIIGKVPTYEHKYLPYLTKLI